MCGIAGLVRLDGVAVSVDALRPMASAIAHRGPDGDGFWWQGPVGLAHRRLSVIDLSPAAAQPMVAKAGGSVLSYNGEVYNFREIRAELEALGHVFDSRSDTEVVLVALCEWGAAALQKFNGMFALAWWNPAKRTLLLARDRYGIKPLYYAQQGQILAFGSEQKAILALPEIRARLDREALVEYFTFQNLFTDRTLLRDVRILPAGHYAVVKTDQAPPEPVLRQYWDFDFAEPPASASDEEMREELDRLVQQAVRRQLVSDVELGCYLSGGVDSGSITAIAARELPYLRTFTCGFDLTSASGLELAYDERPQAEQMSRLFKTEQYEIILKAGDMERALPKLAWHLEEPRVGQSYPNFYAAKLASGFVKVVLSGSGGDELFGGYPWRYYRPAESDGFEDYIDRYYHYWQRLMPNTLLKQVFAPMAPDVARVWTRDIFRDVFQHHAPRLTRPEDYVNHSLYFEAKTFLHGLLVVEDKVSMAHGLESRVPFLDNDLVDFAMRCPVRSKLSGLGPTARQDENEVAKYRNGTTNGKTILRDVMQRYVPPEVAMARKQGFSAPDASWFAGDSMAFVRRTLFAGAPRIYELMDRETVQRLVSEHLNGTTNRRLLIWSLLNVEAWLQQVPCDL